MFISVYICLGHCLINIVISGVTPVSGIGGSSPSSNFPSFLPLIGSTPPNSNISQCLQQPARSFLNSKKYIHLTCTSTSKGCHQVFHIINKTWPQNLKSWHQFKTWPQKLIKWHQFKSWPQKLIRWHQKLISWHQFNVCLSTA